MLLTRAHFFALYFCYSLQVVFSASSHAGSWTIYNVASNGSYINPRSASSPESLVTVIGTAPECTDANDKKETAILVVDQAYFSTPAPVPVTKKGKKPAATPAVNPVENISGILSRLYEDFTAIRFVKDFDGFIGSYCKRICGESVEGKDLDSRLFDQIKAFKITFSADKFTVFPYLTFNESEDPTLEISLNFSNQLASLFPSSVPALLDQSIYGWKQIIELMKKNDSASGNPTVASKPPSKSSIAMPGKAKAADLELTEEQIQKNLNELLAEMETTEKKQNAASSKKNAKKEKAAAAAAEAREAARIKKEQDEEAKAQELAAQRHQQSELAKKANAEKAKADRVKAEIRTNKLLDEKRAREETERKAKVEADLVARQLEEARVAALEQEKARVAAIKLEEDRLAAIKKKKDDRLAAIKKKGDDRLAAFKKKEVDRFEAIRKREAATLANQHKQKAAAALAKQHALAKQQKEEQAPLAALEQARLDSIAAELEKTRLENLRLISMVDQLEKEKREKAVQEVEAAAKIPSPTTSYYSLFGNEESSPNSSTISDLGLSPVSAPASVSGFASNSLSALPPGLITSSASATSPLDALLRDVAATDSALNLGGFTPNTLGQQSVFGSVPYYNSFGASSPVASGYSLFPTAPLNQQSPSSFNRFAAPVHQQPVQYDLLGTNTPYSSQDGSCSGRSVNSGPYGLFDNNSSSLNIDTSNSYTSQNYQNGSLSNRSSQYSAPFSNHSFGSQPSTPYSAQQGCYNSPLAVNSSIPSLGIQSFGSHHFTPYHAPMEQQPQQPHGTFSPFGNSGSNDGIDRDRKNMFPGLFGCK